MTTYDVMILDCQVSAGETEIDADDLDSAIADATAWARDGDWDHPGEITIVLRDGEDEVYRAEISVGDTM